MELYVVVDTKGAGRILAVYDSQDKAERLTLRHPAYYKLQRVRLNRIDPEALGWADSDEQRRFLQELMALEDG